MAVNRILIAILPTGWSTQDWTCLFSDEFSAKGIKLQFSQYQNQNTPVPSTDKVDLFYSKVQKLLVTYVNTLETFHMRFQLQILDVCWWVHVSKSEVVQRSGLSTIGDILRHRRLSLFGLAARMDPRVLAHYALRLTVDTYEGRKAS